MSATLRRARHATPRLLLFLSYSSLFKSRLTLFLLVAAVAAGVGFQIPNSANFTGYADALLDEGLASGFGDVRLRPAHGARFDDGDALAARVASMPGVRAAVPLLTLPGAVGSDGHFLGVPVSALDATAGRRPFRLIAGALPPRGDHTGLLLGSALAGRLGVKAGATVQLRVILATGSPLALTDSLGRYDMVVRGIVAGTFGAYESVFVDRDFLAGELGESRAASTVLVYLDDHFAAPAMAQALGAREPEALARAWMDDSPYIATSLHANDALRTVSHAMVVAGVAIPVWALLYINVLTRRREVALLGALGFDRVEIFVTFLLQALVVGLLGCAIGCALGYGVVRWFQSHPIFEYEGFVIRPLLSVACFLRPVLIVLATTVGAGVWPAVRASRLDPGQSLRGGE